MNLPKVSALLLSYNHEKYLNESINSVLNQNYTGEIEFIISDDCSTDRSLEIINEVISKFNKLNIQVNSNSQNLGIGDHLNLLMSMAKGELCVVFAGDDISKHNRISAICEYWEKNGRPTSIYSAIEEIDAGGKVVRERRGVDTRVLHSNILINKLLKREISILGCSHAWHREVFDVFGGLDRQIVNEDRTIPVRSALLHGIGFVDEPLVQYRITGGISDIKMTNNTELLYNYYKINSSRELVDLMQNEKDLLLVDNKIGLKILRSRRAYISLMNKLSNRKANFFDFYRAVIDGASIKKCLALFYRYYLGIFFGH